ncbi:MAG: hypothetical protein JO000_15970 [Alphaproteobacteria bacterium]|nr:hypothetical protein [Alphaproteobacteria bacterium]
MAKRANVAKAKVGKKAGKKAKKAKAAAPHPEDHVDGCLCDLEVPAHLYTRDEDLPPAKGGVAPG